MPVGSTRNFTEVLESGTEPTGYADTHAAPRTADRGVVGGGQAEEGRSRSCPRLLAPGAGPEHARRRDAGPQLASFWPPPPL